VIKNLNVVIQSKNKRNMKAINKITSALSFIKNLRTKKTILTISMDDLIHPRFGINENRLKDCGKTANCLQFLMYSKENDTLFI
jgi:hypothetical protein